MSTTTHPAPLSPRGRFGFRPKRHAATATPAAGEQGPAPTTYTRSALPLALSWFVIPLLLLVISLALHWPR